MRAHGRAKVNSRSPEAFAICDNCGFLYNHSELRWQLQWSGNKLVNLRQLVCRRCNDIPQTQLRAIVLPADPVPVQNPRVNNWQQAETNYRTTSGQDTIDPRTGIPIPGNTRRITENDDFRVTQQTGEPPGGLNFRPGTDPNAPGNDDPGLPYNNVDVPKTGPLSPPYIYQVGWQNSSGGEISWINQYSQSINWTTTTV
jgi:hypothetical protein